MNIILTHHLSVCDQVYACLMTENSHLRQARTLPEAEFLASQSSLIGVLKASIGQLKSIVKVSVLDKPLVDKCQKKTLKIFHLLRENEQLILNLQNKF